ncbi:Cytochrome P450 [Arabidopsis thaliana x Arabidopsis arenosa]|uniref:Cytochrome P450 n=1 Tax=Arabidopsis thaliana x Arabidopsis arenosa TaxID=1240361 RepID=A0A8T1XL76_9BRAS|nr:Cytochrome P450 [Arabidopsis thaliana x Arabidopsis arenosa]
MATWFLIIFVSLTLSFLLHLFLRRTNSLPLPPNPNFFPILGPFQWLRQGFDGFYSYLRSIHHRLGPIISLRIFSVPAIFVSDRSLAHKALVLNGAVFSDRPPALPTGKIISSNQHTISSGTYGATWRLLRRNLTSEILHPSRVRSYSNARRSVLENLCSRIRNHGDEEGKPIVVVDHLRYAMFSLLVLMCFGDKLDEEQIKQVEFVQRRELLTLPRFNILNAFPSFTKLFLRKRWEEFLMFRREHKNVLLPLIRSRRKMIEESKDSDKEYVQSYVDTLLDLELPEEKRKLNEDEIVSLCSEFLNAGTDTTATTLQWIMANLVKYQEIQKRLYEEIKTVIGEVEEKEIEEEEMKKMPYLKAKGTFNINVAMIGRDPTVWEEPMEFKPERFIGEEEVDVTGSRGIKMMPFGAGRRICPGIGLAMLHLEYFVVNLVKEFEWKEVEGDEVDLSEKWEFTVVMKYPLKARAVPRMKNKTHIVMA